MKTIMANIWGAQKKVHLGTWAEIRKRGLRPSHRAFGTLNDGTQALFFSTGSLSWEHAGKNPFQRWYVTTETLDEVYQKEEIYQNSN